MSLCSRLASLSGGYLFRKLHLNHEVLKKIITLIYLKPTCSLTNPLQLNCSIMVINKGGFCDQS